MYYNFPEQRVHQRFGQDLPVQCRTVSEQEFLSARLVDFSRGGAFIELDRLMPAGEEVVLKIVGCRPQKVEEEASRTIRGRVVWAVRHGKKGSGEFGAGIHFLVLQEW
jgi:Tfp pilus assembly protein PilZ